MTLSRLVGERELIVCVGPGGVGKTTFGAAVAIEAARAGRRTAVITIDPARRLADALGLDGLDDELRPVASLPLHAAMLETKAAYDALIGRITDDPTARERILQNRVYQSFSRTLARSHAYVAMERLYDVTASGDFDLVVLDTPPTRSAIDILDAPGRLVSFLDERVLNAFLGEGERGARAWIRARSTQVAMRLFGAMAGDALMDELAGFFDVFFHLRQGFAQRAAVIQERLAADSTAFALVTAPDATHLADAAYLRDGLAQRGTALDLVVFNRAFHPGLDGAPLTGEASWAADAITGPAHLDAITQAAHAHRANLVDDNLAFQRAMAAFVTELPEHTERLTLPVLDAEPATLEDLTSLLGRAAEARVQGK